LKKTLTTDSPGMDCERTISTPEVPASAASIGWVTCNSTSSADRPGASAWITTWLGENSGKTSRFARVRMYTP